MQRSEGPQPASARRGRFIAAGASVPLDAAVWPPAGLLDGLSRLQRYEATTNIRYADGPRHKLDVYRPRGDASVPVIVFFYGGSWQSGAKNMYRFLGAALAARGYVVIVPDYRVYPDVRFPDFLADGARVLRWAHDNIARFHGDAGRIFVMGHSAGAHIAAMLALDGEWLDGVGLEPNRDLAGLIGVSGPYDILPLRDPILKIIFGGDNRPETQPIAFAEGSKPPALLLSGDADRTVDPANSTRLADKLRRDGNDATALTYRNFGHITIMAAFAPLVGRIFRPLRDLDAFVERVRPAAHQGAALHAGVSAS